MVMHARSGGSLEVMGLMQGKIDPDDPRGPSLIIMDAFALPVPASKANVSRQVQRDARGAAAAVATHVRSRAMCCGQR